MGSLEPQRGVYDWAPADQLVDLARRNGQTVRGHTLIWHNQLPAWLTSGTFTPAEFRQILRQHIFEVVRHFKRRIWHWDVANEVIDDNGQLRDTIFLRQLGPGYIADAFRWAQQADPRARLYLNDYNNEGIKAKSDAYYALVQQLRRAGVPVHGYGMQGHFATQYGFPGDVLENVRRFEALGLETAFTEVDVRIPLPVDAAELQAQAQGYNTLMQACLLARRCVSYTVWGFTDRYSWFRACSRARGSGPARRELRIQARVRHDPQHPGLGRTPLTTTAARFPLPGSRAVPCPESGAPDRTVSSPTTSPQGTVTRSQASDLKGSHRPAPRPRRTPSSDGPAPRRAAISARPAFFRAAEDEV